MRDISLDYDIPPAFRNHFAKAHAAGLAWHKKRMESPNEVDLSLLCRPSSSITKLTGVHSIDCSSCPGGTVVVTTTGLICTNVRVATPLVVLQQKQQQAAEQTEETKTARLSGPSTILSVPESDMLVANKITHGRHHEEAIDFDDSSVGKVYDFADCLESRLEELKAVDDDGGREWHRSALANEILRQSVVAVTSAVTVAAVEDAVAVHEKLVKLIERNL